MSNPTVPQYVYTDSWVLKANLGSGLPVVTPSGVYVTDQTTLDSMIAIAAPEIHLNFSTTNPHPGGSGGGSPATYAVESVAGLGGTITSGELLSALGTDSKYVPLPVSGDDTGSVPTKQSDGTIAYAVPSGGGGGGGTGTVTEVNGQSPDGSGHVTLTPANIGAATSAQGTKADSAVQPGALATVATTGEYASLLDPPTLGTAAAEDIGYFATAAQGALAADAVPKPVSGDPTGSVPTKQSDGTISYIVPTGGGGGGAGTVTQVAGVNPDESGHVALTPADISAATAAQGAEADTAIQPGDLATVATSGAYGDLSGKPTLGTAAAESTAYFATAAQGTKADSAVQSSDLATVATTGVYADLLDKPTILALGTTSTTALAGNTPLLALGTTSTTALAGNTAYVPQTRTVNGKALSANVTLAASDVGAATTAQGAEADSAVQPGDIGTAAAQDVSYFATAAQGALADSALQTGSFATVATTGDASDLTGLLAALLTITGSIMVPVEWTGSAWPSLDSGLTSNTAVGFHFIGGSAASAPPEVSGPSVWDYAE